MAACFSARRSASITPVSFAIRVVRLGGRRDTRILCVAAAAAGEPVADHWPSGFWRARFKIGQAFSTRPDTETLVEAGSTMRRGSLARLGISTLGLARGQSFARLCKSLPDRRCGCRYPSTPAHCRENLAALGLESRGLIVCGDWTNALRGRFHVIVSNPPMSRAVQSLDWSRRFAILIRGWPSMEAKTVWPPIANHPAAVSWRLAV